MRTALSVALAILASLFIATTSMAAAGWGARESISPKKTCFALAATVDASGGAHAIAQCDDAIVAFDRLGMQWTTRSVAATGINSDPQIAVDGETLYVAFTHNVAVTCGDDLSRPGVYVRHRTLPDGSWSAVQFLGQDRDRLRSFVAVDGHLHAVVQARSGDTFYETDQSGVLRRYPARAATGNASLRVGSDGRARIVYETQDGLRDAVFTGAALTSTRIPGTNDRDTLPQLVLDAADHSHVSWTHTLRFDGGCVEPDDNPSLDGAYYATDAGGSWTAPAARRITPRVGPTSIALMADGEPMIVVGSDTGVRVYRRATSGAWAGQAISSLAASDVAIRLDPTSDRPIAVFAADGRLYAIPGV